MDEVSIDLDSFSYGEDLRITITRSEFEDMCKYLFDKIIPLIVEILENWFLGKNQIDKIILTGGITRIPKVKQIIKEFFRLN